MKFLDKKHLFLNLELSEKDIEERLKGRGNDSRLKRLAESGATSEDLKDLVHEAPDNIVKLDFDTSFMLDRSMKEICVYDTNNVLISRKVQPMTEEEISYFNSFSKGPRRLDE
jgi:hypothetical protein